MEKIKILEVNNIDLPGRRFNGYDMISDLSNFFDIKQAVIIKQSDNKNVIKILDNKNLMKCYETFLEIESELSIHNVFSITSSALINMREFIEADIIHFHMFHNTKLSLYSLAKIANYKKVVISIHDPWFITGRCVHFFDCNLWKNGCDKCPCLNTLFPFTKDNCSQIWNLKKKVFDKIDVDLIVSSDWMLNLVKESPITKNQKNVHKIPFGIDYKKFSSVSYKNARNHFGFKNNEVVLFLRAQNDFKGTKYVLEALKLLETKKKVKVLTCDNKDMLKEIEDKFDVIDLGVIGNEEMIYAMNACDIFLMPSIGESFGMMAVEAMSCSKPVVVFDNSALPSVTDAPNCGYLVRNRDSKDLMKAIKFLVENPNECKKRGKLGFQLVTKNYSLYSYNNKLIKMYNSVSLRKHNTFEFNIQNNSKNIDYFKMYLNRLTIRLFGKNNSLSKNLIFDVKESELEHDIEFDDLEIQELLYNYTLNLEKILSENDDIVNIKSKNKFYKYIKLLKENPRMFFKKMFNKLRKK